ncbi:hypothetical protein Tco_0170021, partial [Tanacetum coccineum]
ACVQQLESSRIYLTHLEQELKIFGRSTWSPGSRTGTGVSPIV